MARSQQDRRFFGKAWRSMASTKSLFGKLCLLTLLQIVPIVGQMALLGCALSWAREAAWGMETPLPKHILGANTPGFWSRGAKAWCAIVLYDIVAAAFDVLLVGGMYACAGMLDGVARQVVVALFVAAIVVVDILMIILLVMGLIRLAIYDRFSTAWQWGQQMRMAARDFGGLIKIALGYIVLSIVIGCLVAIAGCCVWFASGLVLGGTTSFVSWTAQGAITNFIALNSGIAGIACLPICLAAFFLYIPGLIVGLITWRALGNWASGLHVEQWGAPGDPLPDYDDTPVTQAPRNPAEEGEVTASANGETVSSSLAVIPVEPAKPQKHGHPVAIIVVTVLICIVASAAVVGAYAVRWSNTTGNDDILEGMTSDAGLSGEWKLSNGQSVEMHDDGTFVWNYGDGQWISGTYQSTRRGISAGDLSYLVDEFGRGRINSLLNSGFIAGSSYDVRLTVTKTSSSNGSDDSAVDQSFDVTFVSLTPLSLGSNLVIDQASDQTVLATTNM